MNKLRITSTFRRGYANKKKAPRAVLEGVKDGIRELRASPTPEALGEKKHGGLDNTRGYRINLSNRILYGVRHVDGVTVVALLRVCDHRVYIGELSPSERTFFSQPEQELLKTVETEDPWLGKVVQATIPPVGPTEAQSMYA
jgi:hypothetical protein